MANVRSTADKASHQSSGQNSSDRSTRNQIAFIPRQSLGEEISEIKVAQPEVNFFMIEKELISKVFNRKSTKKKSPENTAPSDLTYAEELINEYNQLSGQKLPDDAVHRIILHLIKELIDLLDWIPRSDEDLNALLHYGKSHDLIGILSSQQLRKGLMEKLGYQIERFKQVNLNIYHKLPLNEQFAKVFKKISTSNAECILPICYGFEKVLTGERLEGVLDYYFNHPESDKRIKKAKLYFGDYDNLSRPVAEQAAIGFIKQQEWIRDNASYLKPYLDKIEIITHFDAVSDPGYINDKKIPFYTHFLSSDLVSNALVRTVFEYLKTLIASAKKMNEKLKLDSKMVVSESLKPEITIQNANQGFSPSLKNITAPRSETLLNLIKDILGMKADLSFIIECEKEPFDTSPPKDPSITLDKNPSIQVFSSTYAAVAKSLSDVKEEEKLSPSKNVGQSMIQTKESQKEEKYSPFTEVPSPTLNSNVPPQSFITKLESDELLVPKKAHSMLQGLFGELAKSGVLRPGEDGAPWAETAKTYVEGIFGIKLSSPAKNSMFVKPQSNGYSSDSDYKNSSDSTSSPSYSASQSPPDPINYNLLEQTRSIPVSVPSARPHG